MWPGADFEFRRGLGLALLGIAFLLGANFFGLLAVQAGVNGSANSVIGLVLAMAGGLLSLIGAGMMVTRPAYPPQYPART